MKFGIRNLDRHPSSPGAGGEWVGIENSKFKIQNSKFDIDSAASTRCRFVVMTER
jgi:hypothetical protein